MEFVCVCDHCDGKTATVFCMSDGAFLCQNCDLEIHSNRTTSRHLRVPYTQCPVWAYREAKSKGRLREGVAGPVVGAQPSTHESMHQDDGTRMPQQWGSAPSHPRMLTQQMAWMSSEAAEHPSTIASMEKGRAVRMQAPHAGSSAYGTPQQGSIDNLNGTTSPLMQTSSEHHAPANLNWPCGLPTMLNALSAKGQQTSGNGATSTAGSAGSMPTQPGAMSSSQHAVNTINHNLVSLLEEFKLPDGSSDSLMLDLPPSPPSVMQDPNGDMRQQLPSSLKSSHTGLASITMEMEGRSPLVYSSPGNTSILGTSPHHSTLTRDQLGNAHNGMARHNPPFGLPLTALQLHMSRANGPSHTTASGDSLTTPNATTATPNANGASTAHGTQAFSINRSSPMPIGGGGGSGGFGNSGRQSGDQGNGLSGLVHVGSTQNHPIGIPGPASLDDDHSLPSLSNVIAGSSTSDLGPLQTSLNNLGPTPDNSMHGGMALSTGLSGALGAICVGGSVHGGSVHGGSVHGGNLLGSIHGGSVHGGNLLGSIHGGSVHGGNPHGSVHGGSVHGGNLHGSVHGGSVHGGNLHGSVHGGSVHGVTLHHANGSVHGGSVHGGNLHGSVHGGSVHGGNQHGSVHGGSVHGGNQHVGSSMHGGNLHHLGSTIHGGSIHGGSVHGGSVHGGTHHIAVGGSVHGPSRVSSTSLAEDTVSLAAALQPSSSLPASLPTNLFTPLQLAAAVSAGASSMSAAMSAASAAGVLPIKPVSLLIEAASAASIEARARALINSSSRTQQLPVFDPNMITRIERPDGTFRELDPERAAQLHRYRQKRLARMKAFTEGQKKIRYECRKQLADSRPRVRGRFAKVGSFDGLGNLFNEGTTRGGNASGAGTRKLGVGDGSMRGACSYAELMKHQRIDEETTVDVQQQQGQQAPRPTGSDDTGARMLRRAISANQGTLPDTLAGLVAAVAARNLAAAAPGGTNNVQGSMTADRQGSLASCGSGSQGGVAGGVCGNTAGGPTGSGFGGPGAGAGTSVSLMGLEHACSSGGHQPSNGSPCLGSSGAPAVAASPTDAQGGGPVGVDIAGVDDMGGVDMGGDALDAAIAAACEQECMTVTDQELEALVGNFGPMAPHSHHQGKPAHSEGSAESMSTTTGAHNHSSPGTNHRQHQTQHNQFNCMQLLQQAQHNSAMMAHQQINNTNSYLTTPVSPMGMNSMQHHQQNMQPMSPQQQHQQQSMQQLPQQHMHQYSPQQQCQQPMQDPMAGLQAFAMCMDTYPPSDAYPSGDQYGGQNEFADVQVSSMLDALLQEGLNCPMPGFAI